MSCSVEYPWAGLLYLIALGLQEQHNDMAGRLCTRIG